MNIKKFGIIAGLVIIIIAVLTTIFGFKLLPGMVVIPIIGIVLAVMGVVVMVLTIRADNQMKREQRRRDESR